MNKKGEVILGYVFGVIVVGMVAAAAVLTPNHRIRQANEFCQDAGYSANFCEYKVENMSKDQILAYIKDDDMSIGNRGNF